MPASGIEFHLPSLDWQPTHIPGLSDVVLAEDPETGANTRLARFEPGADTSALGTVEHAFREESYILEGELIDLGLEKTFTAGMYAWRPVGMPHGPYRSIDGCLLLEIRYGYVE